MVTARSPYESIAYTLEHLTPKSNKQSITTFKEWHHESYSTKGQ